MVDARRGLRLPSHLVFSPGVFKLIGQVTKLPQPASSPDR